MNTANNTADSVARIERGRWPTTPPDCASSAASTASSSPSATAAATTSAQQRQPGAFRPRLQGVDDTGRVAEVTGLRLNDTWLFALDPSMLARWYEGADGHQRWREQP